MTAILFPTDPLSPRRVDEHFAAQAAAVRELGGQVALIDHDALLRGAAGEAVRRVPPDLGPAFYRGWMIPSARYAELETALLLRGATLATTAAAYRRAHELPGWYDAFAEVTPASVWSTGPEVPAGVDRLGGGPGIVKDYVKSRKHEWAEACFIPDLADPEAVRRVAGVFAERQDDFLAGGIVLRKYEELAREEARVWWLDGEPILVGPHPDTPDVTPEPDLSVVPRAGLERFVTTDLALRSDGVWRVLEMGDGQVSDLPAGIDPVRLMKPLVES